MRETLAIISKSEAYTQALARRFAEQLNLGDVLILNGEVGTGKTVFVKALSEALGTKDPVTSPTYTIANFYRLEEGQIIHLDVYRLKSIEEFRDLGLHEFFDEAISIIEWGKPISDEFENYLEINFAFHSNDDNQRNLELAAVGPKANSSLTAIIKSLKLD